MTPPVAPEAKRPKSLATSVVETSVVASAVARALEHECYSARDLQGVHADERTPQRAIALLNEVEPALRELPEAEHE